VLSGQRDNGAAFVRTAEHSVRVVPRSADLTGDVDLSIDMANHRLVFDLGVKQHAAPAGFEDMAGRYRAYFELYGKSIVSGKQVPIAWSSGIASPMQGSNGASVISLEVDMGWLVEARAVGPFTLKNVYLQEVNTFIPVSSKESIDFSLRATHDVELWRQFVAVNATHTPGQFTEQMRFGVRPEHLRATNATEEKHGLVLSHGYCSGGNPWLRTKEIWTDAYFFEDPNQSRSHDKFAQLIVEFAESQGLTSFSIIGHSQGGFAALHTHNYYWSGVDNARVGRKLQSLGSPYQGNSGAGFWSEVLNMLVEEGCDPQEDLTRDGAELWLTGISAASAGEMHYYTTQYDKGGLLGKGYCNMLTNAVLKSPNDGVTENDYAHLPGGNFEGNTVGQCHIDGMNWPASFDDVDRNKIMNELAAR